MSVPFRWMTPSGRRNEELSELIRRACNGERWADIAETFYPDNTNGIRKACDTFATYAAELEKAQRREALAARGYNRGPTLRAPKSLLGGRVEPALIREKQDPWDGLGNCFANPRQSAA